MAAMASLAVRNRYFALRHGISIANEQGLIISDPQNAVDDWGLSDRGIAECKRLLASRRLAIHGFRRAQTITYTSDFRRAAETARIFCELNELDEPILDDRLRERNFGRFENQSVDAYQQVWARDVDDDRHAFEGCESTGALAARLCDLLLDLESRWQDKSIVLVSHGDPLQVFQTILLGMKCNEHRTLPHLGNAELRPL
jgi:probable phosphoglycerate mutase